MCAPFFFIIIFLKKKKKDTVVVGYAGQGMVGAPVHFGNTISLAMGGVVQLILF